MTFNPNAESPSMEGGFSAYSKSLPIGGGKYKTFAYSSNATNAIDFIMDVNGGSGPNQEPDLKGRFYDIRSFKLATFTPQACPGGTRISGYCLVELGLDYEPYNCVTRPDGGDYCVTSAYWGIGVDHYWAGANRACAELGMKIPNPSEFTTLTSSNLSGWDFSKYMHDSIWSNHRYGLGKNGAHQGSPTMYTKSPVLCIKQD